jgi:fanconi-associated nuclease 1
MDRFIQRSRRNKTDAQPSSAPVHSNHEEPPRKRCRLEEVKGSDDEDQVSTPTSVDGDGEVDGDDDDESAVKRRAADDEDPDLDVDDEEPSRPEHQTAFESSLPAVSTDKEAIQEYETMRASQESQASQGDPDDPSARMDNRKWVRGKSSIYVDAFNLALDTVLEDESHLFDAKEMCVFAQWRGLSYEAQYL